MLIGFCRSQDYPVCYNLSYKYKTSSRHLLQVTLCILQSVLKQKYYSQYYQKYNTFFFEFLLLKGEEKAQVLSYILLSTV